MVCVPKAININGENIMKRFVIMLEDENEDRHFLPFDAEDADDAEEQALRDNPKWRTVTIYQEI